MFQHFAAPRLSQSFFHFADRSFVVTNPALERFRHERLRVASLLGGKAVQFGLQFRRTRNVLVARLGAAPVAVKPFGAFHMVLHPPKEISD